MHRRGTLILIVGVLMTLVLSQGCHSLQPIPSDKKIVAEGFTVLNTTPCIHFRWFGENEWRLSKTGWGGGGHHPYEVYLRTDEPQDYKAIEGLYEYDGPIKREPTLLLPLFDSHNTETVLAAMYVFREAHQVYDTLGPGLGFATGVNPVAAKLRSLLYTHRDVRVRCMAADIMLAESFLVLDDVDKMLSDSNLCVRIIGVESVDSVSRQINRLVNLALSESLNNGLNQANHGEDYPEEINRKLVSILLRHLNDNHFYIRSSCYNAFRSQTGNTSPKPYRHFFIDVPETYLKVPLWWAHESWTARGELQRDLLSWWESNKGELRIGVGALSSAQSIDGSA